MSIRRHATAAKAPNDEMQAAGSVATHQSTSPQSAARRARDTNAVGAGDVLGLQRSAGNQAVQQMLSIGVQAKLELGPVDDKYEREADAVAKQVVGQLDTSTADVGAAAQRQTEDEELRMKSVQRQSDDDELRMKRVQRQSEEEEIRMKSLPVQRVIGEHGGELSGDVERTIQSARGGGKQLADSVRGPMESAFGVDFGGVRVHTDSRSDNLNRSLQARAFTTGQDVFFRSGDYKPGSSSGNELIAHELTHVVQQSGGTLQPARAQMKDKDA